LHNEQCAEIDRCAELERACKQATRWSWNDSVERRKNFAVSDRQRRSIVVDDVTVVIVSFVVLAVIEQLTKRVQLHSQHAPTTDV